MQQFQKILFLVAVLTLGFSIYYYMNLDKPQKINSSFEPDKAGFKPAGDPLPEKKEFNVRDYGVEGAEGDRLNDYLQAVKEEVSGIISRDETVVILLSEFKTKDDYKQKLYMALSLANRLKVISPIACDNLKKKISETSDISEQDRLKKLQEYIVCFPGKW